MPKKRNDILSPNEKKALFKSIESGDLKSIKNILANHPELLDTLGEHNAYCRDKTPLMFALQYREFEIAAWLIDAGANVNFKMPAGPKTPVLNYCVLPFVPFDLLEKMLRNGCDPNLLDVYGDTALHVVLENTGKELEEKGVEKITLLATHGAEFDEVRPSEDPDIEPCSPRELAKHLINYLPKKVTAIFDLHKPENNIAASVKSESNVILEHPDEEFGDYRSALVCGFSKIDALQRDQWIYLGVQGGTESAVKEDVFAIKGRRFLFCLDQIHKRRRNKSYISWFSKIEKDDDGFCLLPSDVTAEQLAELVDFICTRITKLPKFQGDYAIGFEYWPDFDYDEFKNSVNNDE